MFKTSGEPTFQKTFISLVFQRLLSFVLYACYNVSNNHSNLTVYTSSGHNNGVDSKSHNTYNIVKSNEIVSINFVPFGEKALLILVNLYDESASNESVIENHILKSIIQVI